MAKQVDHITFHVRPDRSSRYYLIRIFRTREAMVQFAKQHPVYADRASGSFFFRAICTAFTRIRVDKKVHPNIGHMLFYTGGFGAGVVAHEMTHATVYWMQRHTRMSFAKLPDCKRTDERFAYVLGSMVNQFWRKYYKAKRKVSWLK